MDNLVETLERATLDAVAPADVAEIPGWLLPMDASRIGRATSAVPLRHSVVDTGAISAIEARYRHHGYAPRFRIAETPGLADLRQALMQRGYTADKPTLTRLVNVRLLCAIAPGCSVTIAHRPTASWASVYMATSADPAEGQSRVAALSRGANTLYAEVADASGAVASGTATVGRGWLGIHGLRTLPAARGRGYASQIMRALAERAQEAGVADAFLQVEEDNETANRLYTRLGFATAWRYHYWTQPEENP